MPTVLRRYLRCKYSDEVVNATQSRKNSQIPMTTSENRHGCTSQGIKREPTIAKKDYDHL